MQTVACPVCETDLNIHEDDITLYAHVFCGECETMHEIIKESPLMLSPIDDDFDDEDLEDDEL